MSFFASGNGERQKSDKNTPGQQMAAVWPSGPRPGIQCLPFEADSQINLIVVFSFSAIRNKPEFRAWDQWRPSRLMHWFGRRREKHE
jgi:hypothetical protein